VGPYKGVCVSSVDIGNHLVADYQCKKGSRCVEITGFQVGGSSVGGARNFLQPDPYNIGANSKPSQVHVKTHNDHDLKRKTRW